MQSKPEHQGDGTPFTDDYLLFLLAQASAVASNAFHDELRKGGLSVSTWRILASLFPDLRLTVNGLAQKCLLKQPTLTRALDRLERDGLVKRLASSNDRRQVLIELTKPGFALASEKVAQAQRHEGDIIELCSADQIVSLKKDLLNLLAHLNSSGAK